MLASKKMMITVNKPSLCGGLCVAFVKNGGLLSNFIMLAILYRFIWTAENLAIVVLLPSRLKQYVTQYTLFGGKSLKPQFLIGSNIFCGILF